MIAVIKTGGKQYKVTPGDKIKIEKLELEVGKEVIFDAVLLVEHDGAVEVGDPLVQGAKVIGKIINQDKFKKVIILKYKPKTREKTKKGHRQPYTEIEILKIDL